MNHRLASILNRSNQTADITKVIDLNLSDPVSQFQIIYEPLSASGITPVGHPALCISKIELVDGSDVLYSLSGMEAQAVDWYHRKQEAPNIMLYLNGNASYMIYNINFGRYLWDPLFAFDPKKFTNPQLKITIDINAGGSDVTSGYLTVLAMIFDEKAITPEGFFMHKEVKDYTLSASSHEYTDLPVDYPYRKLFARILKYGTGTENCFGTLKLSEDNDKRIPFNHSIAEILATMVGQTRPYREWIIGWGQATAQYMYCTPAYWPAISGSPWRSATLTTGLVFYGGDGGRFQTSQAAAGPNWQALVEGWCPHGVVEIPFGIQNEPADWYNVSKLGSLTLDLLSASGVGSSDSCQIFLQQLRKY